MVDTTIYIGGIPLHEPVTTITDYIIAIQCFYFYTKLKRMSNDTTVKHWSIFFGLLGISTLFGGTAHGFFEVHEGIAYKSVWLFMQVVNGFSVYFAQQATLSSVLKNSEYAHWWKLSYQVQLLVFLILLVYFQNYMVTIVENAIGLIPIMLLHFTSKPSNNYHKKIAYGILISFSTVIVYATKFSLHAHFNFNDIAHVFIMVSLWVMYSGSKQRA